MANDKTITVLGNKAANVMVKNIQSNPPVNNNSVPARVTVKTVYKETVTVKL